MKKLLIILAIFTTFILTITLTYLLFFKDFKNIGAFVISDDGKNKTLNSIEVSENNDDILISNSNTKLKMSEGSNYININGNNYLFAINNETYVLQKIDENLNLVETKELFNKSLISDSISNFYSEKEIEEAKSEKNFRIQNHHELWTDNEYSAGLLSTLSGESGGLTDDDSLIILKNNGNSWKVENIINVMKILGFNNSNLYDETKEKYKLNAINHNPKIAGETFDYNDRISLDFLHLNAFDYNYASKRIFISSRTLGSIIVLDASDIHDIKLELILSNPITYNYLNSSESENPIIKYDGESSFNWNGYMHNDKYNPKIKSEWEGKTLDYKVNGETYKSNDVYWDLNEEYLFMGQHNVKSLNKFFEDTEIYDGYNPEHEYISIFDNHASQDNPYQIHYSSEEGNKIGANKVDIDKDEKFDKGALTPYDGNAAFDECVSYFKIIDIDPTNRVATLIANEEIPYSSYISNANIYRIENKNYVFVHSGFSKTNSDKSEDAIYSFDKINNNTINPNDFFSNWKLIWNKKYDFVTYRGYLIPYNNLEWYTGQGLTYKI